MVNAKEGPEKDLINNNSDRFLENIQEMIDYERLVCTKSLLPEEQPKFGIHTLFRMLEEKSFKIYMEWFLSSVSVLDQKKINIEQQIRSRGKSIKDYDKDNSRYEIVNELTSTFENQLNSKLQILLTEVAINNEEIVKQNVYPKTELGNSEIYKKQDSCLQEIEKCVQSFVKDLKKICENILDPKTTDYCFEGHSLNRFSDVVKDLRDIIKDVIVSGVNKITKLISKSFIELQENLNNQFNLHEIDMLQLIECALNLVCRTMQNIISTDMNIIGAMEHKMHEPKNINNWEESKFNENPYFKIIRVDLENDKLIIEKQQELLNKCLTAKSVAVSFNFNKIYFLQIYIYIYHEYYFRDCEN